MFLFLASVAICDVGSEPIDKMHTSGVRGSDSDHVTSKSKISISLYSGPSDSVVRIAKIIGGKKLSVKKRKIKSIPFEMLK